MNDFLCPDACPCPSALFSAAYFHTRSHRWWKNSCFCPFRGNSATSDATRVPPGKRAVPLPPASGGERKAGARPGFPAGWRVICPQKRDIGVAQLPLGPAASRCLVQLGLWDRTSGLSAYAEDFISEVTCGQSSSMVRQGQQAAARPAPTSADSILALTDPLKPGRGSVLASVTSTQASPSPRHSARPRASAESPSRSGELPSQVPSTLQPPAPRPGRSRKPVLARIPQGTDFEIRPRRILSAHVLQNDT